MNITSRLLPYLCAITLPLAVQLVWLLHNTQLPISDATGSYLASYNLAHLAFAGKWQEFITGLYSIRDWRPTALCLVLLPFALASGGNLMFMATGLCFTSLLISITYIYHLLRLALPTRHAALGTALLGLMPALQHPATYFGYTEAPFMAAMLASFYHLLRSDHFSNAKHSYILAGVSALAFCLRPIEAVFHFMPILALCVWQGWRKNKLSFPEIYATLTACCVFASLLVIAGWWPHGLFVFPQSAIFDGGLQGIFFTVVGSGIMLTSVLLATMLVLRYRSWGKVLSKRSHLLASLTIMSALVCGFYYDFMTPLVQWIYLTNLGDLGNVVAPKPAHEKLVHFILGTGALPLMALALLATVNFKRVSSNPLFPLLAVIPLAFALPFFTCQFSQRKVTLLFACLLIVLTALALQHGRFMRLRSAIVVLLILCQGAGVSWISMGGTHTPLLNATVGSRFGFSEMVTTRPNPHDTVVDFMVSRAQKYGYSSISLPILGGEVPRLVDPFLLVILTKIQTGRDLAFFPHINREKEAMITAPRSLFGGDAFLVAADRELHNISDDAAAIRADASVSWLPSDNVAYEILARHAEGTLEALGVHQRDCITVAPTQKQVCLYDYSH